MKASIKKLTILTMLAMLVGLTLSVGLVQAKGNVKLQWSPGWDTLNRPLDIKHSFVSYNNPNGSSNLRVLYSLKGASPNTSHNVGLHLFWDNTSQCIPAFGQFDRFNCFVATRQSVTSAVQGHNLGILTTDGNGNGNLTVHVNGIASGTYKLEFDVSRTTCNFCARIYQSPGPTFGGTTTITIQ